MPIPLPEKKKFERAFNVALNRAKKMPDDAAQLLLRDLRQYRLEVLNIISTPPTEWSMYHAQQIEGALVKATTELERAMGSSLTGSLDGAWAAGAGSIDEAVKVAELTLGGPLVGFSAEDLVLAKEISAGLVTDLSNSGREKIMQSVRLGIMGGKSQDTVIKDIGRVILADEARKGSPASAFKSLADRASFIARTETERVLNAGHYNKATSLHEEYGSEVRKYWMSDYGAGRDHRGTHRSLDQSTNPAHGGQPIAQKRLFQVGNYKARFPLDPRLPAGESVNCLCRLGTTLLDNEELEELYPGGEKLTGKFEKQSEKKLT